MSVFMTFVQFLSDFPAFIAYLKGKAFLKPLSPEDETVYLKLMQEGDESAKHVLIERNMRLVAHVVKKFHPPHDQLDDFISIGTIGLMKAVNSYTFDKQTRLATYAARCIENELLMHLRTKKKSQKDVSIHDSVSSDQDGQSLQIEDTLSSSTISAQWLLEQQESNEKLYHALEKLEKRELEILVRRYGLFQYEQMTQKEIADELQISRSYVSRIEKRALIKLYQLFKRENSSFDQLFIERTAPPSL